VPKLYSSQETVKDSSQETVKALEREGFAFVSQRGSHAKYRKTSSSIVFTVIVPAGRKQIPRGTFRSILRQSGLDETAFKRS
jgi:predicted RNA binding protein YcfA (HicA-like mRNA interferase family)